MISADPGHRNWNQKAHRQRFQPRHSSHHAEALRFYFYWRHRSRCQQAATRTRWIFWVTGPVWEGEGMGGWRTENEIHVQVTKTYKFLVSGVYPLLGSLSCSSLGPHTEVPEDRDTASWIWARHWFSGENRCDKEKGIFTLKASLHSKMQHESRVMHTNP